MSKKSKIIIIGIESSCDETAAALVEIKAGKFKILSNIVSSQIKIHKKYGGVVPEVAARNHIVNILPVIDRALTEAKIKPARIDKIAVTFGPGLITSLMVGLETAKTLAFVWKKPIAAVNHMKAHLYANWLANQAIKYPAICLTVSGGHTELILIKNQTNLKKVGQTVDDAAGEAFDKVAKLLEIGYPGGPMISRLAQTGNPKAFKLARPMINSKDFNFSFSGLKTSVLYAYENSKLKTKNLKLKANSCKLTADMCASFQQAAVDVLAAKTIKAALHFGAKTVMLSGGVAANQLLRETLQAEIKKLKLNFVMPDKSLCTDNAAMIAAAGYFEKPIDWKKIRVNPNLSI
ncbi:MAG: tRNA (adenosine(37)-N6)-threonylcarbamoyltransferase complex transferase subunit TsaD [Candidatus Buchananbacteria bacterium RIFCSPHIGHO2_02_FULL_45_11b]|uniref:tRNA N6-adenosine threonylcarbamoyltransferase n=2 Tax=Candidatus Buchananiibacteriota TaxID=1817903 RepID=A0A1G1YL79_9BACT|nr:MAG: tRNA (adenosine(37)-N6)-threonylcarbamoyltransferase complex transferase subunit TsaD [Candidatus Buchananbacteria bacterium RIFCSPHIGHO2_02_FULL_45_11b]OGY57201.1 MAG: tRNA (adenosine(37)-N6)-threonylcarbamoyltransferase complex transferase subunit TsaD [Candidatus Buchananbacteria bacterium RIFCSPLOWO2_02_FULL_46_11b]